MKKYSFCENVHAGPASKWHIRELTKKGRKLGGGADTPSLCDQQVHWDLSVPVTLRNVTYLTCKKCRLIYLRNRIRGE